MVAGSFLVVLTGTSSHSRERYLRLAKRGKRSRSSAEVSVRKIQLRLSSQEIDRMVAAYQGGRRTTQLAAEFGVHRNTVQRLLKARGLLLTLGPRLLHECSYDFQG